MPGILQSLAASVTYWWGLLGLGLVLEAVALFYQYGLGYGPCPLCVHLRIGVLGFSLLSLLALLIRSRVWWGLSHLLNALIFAWLSERSYWLLGTEWGFTYTECGLDTGLPVWFALDRWLPAIFEAWESCGYTPQLLFGISMAEASTLLFPLLLLISLLMLGYSFARS